METENTIVDPDTHAADGGTKGDTEMHDAESPDHHFEEKKEDGASGSKSSVNSLDLSDKGTLEDEGDGNRLLLAGDAGRRAALVDPSTKSQKELTEDLTGFKFHTRSLVDLTPQGVLRPDPGESAGHAGPLILEGSGEEVTIEYLNSSYRAHIWDVLNSKERRPVVGTYAHQLDKAHKLFETLGGKLSHRYKCRDVLPGLPFPFSYCVTAIRRRKLRIHLDFFGVHFWSSCSRNILRLVEIRCPTNINDYSALFRPNVTLGKLRAFPNFSNCITVNLIDYENILSFRIDENVIPLEILRGLLNLFRVCILIFSFLILIRYSLTVSNQQIMLF